MLNRREWVVKMMQQLSPFLIFRRPTEANGVVFQCIPFHQQQVLVLSFEGAPQFMPTVTAHAGDNRGRNPKSRLKIERLVNLYIEYGDF